MTFLQDLVHCEEHCMQEYRDDWTCGLKKHTDEHTQGCYYGTLNWSPKFEIDEDDFFKLPDPDDYDKAEYNYTVEELEEMMSSDEEQE